MEIERWITIFNNDNEGKLIKEISVDNLDMDMIKTLFTSAPDDPDFYKPYKIEEAQYDAIVKYAPELADYSCDFYDIYMETFI
jgi:hypothetical protein